ncbi:MAG: ABC transporter substrate-binding protein [Rhodospirillaceae bacterium]|nr:ABC transporter substrate-binding protein [Rhodospirillaceae bacterium]
MVLKAVYKTFVVLAIMVAGGGQAFAQEAKSAANDINFVFESTQLSPAGEASKMRNIILKDFDGKVEFRPNDNQFRMRSDNVGLLGGMHSDFESLKKSESLFDVSPILNKIKKRDFSKSLSNLGGSVDGQQSYIPWMQATYIMAANRKSLEYLPRGADINQLSYEQLISWGEEIKSATGKAKIGLPLGSNGLLHRFIQGYLLPAYTGGTVRGFNSDEARDMWKMVKRLWQNTMPNSTDYSEMGQALLNDDAWIVWDHTARLKGAFSERPDDFIAFPAPAGPKGRAFMAVLAGLAIPKNGTDHATAERLIEYMTRPEIQLRTLQEVGFFPVVDLGELADGFSKTNPGLSLLQYAVLGQSSAKDALPVLLPIGLGDKGGEFNTVYRLTFSQIVLRGNDIGEVLATQSERLSQILASQNASCWQPDAPSNGPCPVK